MITDTAASAGATAVWNGVDRARLHTGAPGAAGTSNVLGTGDDFTFAFAAASAGEMLSTGALTWSSPSASGTATYLSLWDGATFIGDAELSAPSDVTIAVPFVVSRVRVRILTS